MNLSKKQLEHLSNLARIRLTKQEEKKFFQDLSSILEYVEQLQEVETEQCSVSTNIEPISQITGLENVDRDDEVGPVDEIVRKELLDNVPEKEKGFVRVKRVL